MLLLLCQAKNVVKSRVQGQKGSNEPCQNALVRQKIVLVARGSVGETLNT